MRTWATLATAAVLSLVLGVLPARAGGCHNTELVSGWYQQYLHRLPDECGLRGWVGQLYKGASPLEVEAHILASDEYYHIHGCSPEGYVTGLYVDVLGRKPGYEELCGWTKNLSRCGCRFKLAREFLCAAKAELSRAHAPHKVPVYAPPGPPVTPVYAPGRPVSPVFAPPAPVSAGISIHFRGGRR
jgi:hypothetical protein